MCREGGHSYHLIFNPPRQAGICDIDGSPLVQRADDAPETIRARLVGTLDDLSEVEAHYRATGVLRTVDGRQPVDDVAAALWRP